PPSRGLRVALLAQRLRAKASSWFPLTPRQTGVASKSFLVLLRPGHIYRESAMPWPAIAGQHLDSRACARCGPLLLVPNLTHLFASACAGNKALPQSIPSGQAICHPRFASPTRLLSQRLSDEAGRDAAEDILVPSQCSSITSVLSNAAHRTTISDTG